MSAMFVATFINDLELKLIVSQQPRGPGRTRTPAPTVVQNSALVSDYTCGVGTPSSPAFFHPSSRSSGVKSSVLKVSSLQNLWNGSKIRFIGSIVAKANKTFDALILKRRRRP